MLYKLGNYLEALQLTSILQQVVRKKFCAQKGETTTLNYLK
jgi:hypothetical protein